MHEKKLWFLWFDWPVWLMKLEYSSMFKKKPEQKIGGLDKSILKMSPYGYSICTLHVWHIYMYVIKF